ncbi:MAG: class I SAM-dependent methyltransferase [Blastochloris sp.]|nr:class I SAM-dependent methyltransferase [Blastochloris sp.]
MPFPSHDPYWSDVAAYLDGVGSGSMMAPDEFVERFPDVYCYEAPLLKRDLDPDCLVLHKGLWGRIPESFLSVWMKKGRPVFANEVFVVYVKRGDLAVLEKNHVHLPNLHRSMRERGEHPRENPRLRPLHFASLDVEGVREAMNERYAKVGLEEFGGYEHPHLWDRERYREVDRLTQRMLGSVTGLRVLELGCGIGRSAVFCAEAGDYLGTDLSDVAIEKARQRCGENGRQRFERMDAMSLRVPDGVMDVVLGVEIIEHVQDAEKMLSEVRRVLKPGGRFIFNSANRDSFHLRMIQKLGLPEFRGTYEHFREFGYGEMCGLLGKHQFEVEEGVGLFLLPYQAVPGVSDTIKGLAENDPQVVEWLRVLGERAGPEFGFEFMIRAKKTGVSANP